MYHYFIEGLQRLGRALMLPIAILPIAGLLLRLGDTDLLNIAIIHDAGQVIFANLAMIFAIGIAVGFAKDNNVIFLSVDTDDDHSVVPKFVAEMKWDHKVYYDAGLMSALKISSIPTIMILDTNGRISSRMMGFIPERFEDMLAERIQGARQTGTSAK